jgi:dihydroflavonol-4-reductase
MRNVFIITGICGHLGNTIANQLAQQGEVVRGLALPHEDSSMLDTSIELVRGDVCVPSSLEPLFAGWQIEDEITVIHSAGMISITGKHDSRMMAVNVGGTKNIIQMCKAHFVKKLIYISSVHAIPELPHGSVISETDRFSPDTVIGLYSKSKATATQMVLDAVREGLHATIVHPAGLIGPNDYGKGLMTQMIADYLNGTLRACVKGGYDFVDVRDVADGVIAAARVGKNGESYILSNRYYSALELLNMLHVMTGRRAIRTILPMWFIRMFVPLAEVYFKMKKERPLFTEDSLAILMSNSVFSHEKASRELGFKTQDMKKTLVDMVVFLQRTGRIRIALAS